jgi:hypothetical protein
VMEEQKEAWVHCSSCMRKFPSEKCFNNHRVENNCDLYFRCASPLCEGQIFPTFKANKLKGQKSPYHHVDGDEGFEHICGKTFWCRICMQWHFQKHRCVIKSKKKKDPYVTVWYADFECYVDKTTRKHVVDYVVAQRTCWMNETGQIEPNGDCQEQLIFQDVESFCEWLCSEEHLGSVFIFHNGRAYDFHFIREWMLSGASLWNFNCIKRGKKIISMTISPNTANKRVRLKIMLLDSISFMSSSLSNLAKTYGVSDKGYFPHRFNDPDNFNYVGDIPAVEFFYESGTEFMEWHQKQISERVVWCFKDEIKKYCIQDVNILRTVFEMFRKKIYEDLNVEVLSVPTLPSLATQIFFSCFYNEEKMTLVTPSPEFTHWARPAMFGGRTNAIKLKYICDATEGIAYYDVTSLYPFVLCKNYFPLTEPHFEYPDASTSVSVYVQRFLSESFHEAGGLCIMECSVTPPNNLYFPVLPNHGGAMEMAEEVFLARNGMNGKKLMFTLLPQKGKWTSIELKLALKHGYVINEIEKIAYWESGETSNVIWQDYVLYFLKKKTLANGQKKILQTFRRNIDDQKATWLDYITQYNNYYDNLCGRSIPDHLRLSSTDSVPQERNAGDYSTYKLFLNSLWGRFSMRNDFYNYQVLKIHNLSHVSAI